MAGSLQSILQRMLRRRIKLTFREVAPVMWWSRGRYRYTPLPGRSNNQIDLYGKQLVKDANAVSSDFRRFLKRVGALYRPTCRG